MSGGRHQTHSIYGASGASRWVGPDACPGAPILGELAPPYTPEFQEPNTSADEGTQAHAFIERVLRGECAEWIASEYPDKAVEGGYGVINLVKELTISDKCEMLIEERLSWDPVGWLPDDDKIFSHPDVMLWHPESRVLHIIDYKHGGVSVSAIENKQLLHLACSARLVYPELGCVVGYIVQPFSFDIHSNPSLDGVKVWAISLERMAQHESEVRQALEANALYYLTDDINTLTLRPSPTNCRWCRGFTVCPKTAEVPQISVLQRIPVSTTPRELGPLLTFSKYLKVWIKEVEGHALKIAREGAELPGFKLVQKKGHRKFLGSAQKTAENLAVLANIEPSLFFTQDLVTPAEAERILRSHMKAKKYPKAQVVEVLEALALMADRPANSQFELAFSSDKRPEVQIGVIHGVDKILPAPDAC